MTSRTADPRAVLAAAGRTFPAATRVAALTGGTFNAVHLITPPEGVPLVLKIAPDPRVPAMTYETSLLATEAAFHRAAARVAPVPEVLALHRAPGEREWLLLEAMPGENWHRIGPELDPTTGAALRYRLGEVAAALHGVVGPGFGYPQFGLVPDWFTAFRAMLTAVLDDAVRFGVSLPWPVERLRGLADGSRRALEAVDSPVLVHFDLWPGNVLVDPRRRRISGIVDGERAMWGDPLAEMASLTLFGAIEQEPDLVAGYRSAGGRIDDGVPVRCRLALYRCYLYLIMAVETVPRAAADGLPRVLVHLRRALHELEELGVA